MIASELPQLKERQDILTISHLRFGFSEKSTPVLHDISLNVYKGEIVAILGGSGCGKSTLLNLIAGLIKPQCGEIKIRDRHNDSSRIGYIFQEDALLPWRTVAANLALAREIGKVPRETFEISLRDFLNSFHLDHSILNKYPTQLSGGMKQRVSIIQTLLFNPSLLLLDEPFSALDFYTKLCLESEFYNLVKDKGKTAILVTHDIEEAIAVADRVVLLGQGGTIHADIPVRFACAIRDPENVRGLAEFAQYYRNIWGQLKTVIGQ